MFLSDAAHGGMKNLQRYIQSKAKQSKAKQSQLSFEIYMF